MKVNNQDLTKKENRDRTKNLKSFMFIVLLTLIIGQIFKFIYFITREDLKSRQLLWITGHHFLKKNYILHIIVIYIVLLVILLYKKFIVYSENNEKKNTLGIVKQSNCFYLFKNIIIIGAFYISYYMFIIPFHKYTEFKISGHYFITVINIFMISNILEALEDLRNIQISQDTIFVTLKYCLLGLCVHYLYSLIFTTYIYHSFLESFSGFILGLIVIFPFIFIEIDSLVYRVLFPDKVFEYIKKE